MKIIYSGILLAFSSLPAFAALVPEVSASGSVAALVVSVGAAVWMIERRRRRS